MIKKTQRQFILVTSGILFIVFLSITLTIAYTNGNREKSQRNNILDMLLKSPSNERPNMPTDSIREARSFVVFITTEGTAVSVIYDANYYTTDDIESLLSEMSLNENVTSQIGHVYYKTERTITGYRLAAVDRSNEVSMLTSGIITLMIVELIAFILLITLSWVLSFYVVKPLKLAQDKQKSFISDASHELKTPLTIINSNAEVLKSDYGDNQWLSHIFDQVDHMNHLVSSLLSISSLNEQNQNITYQSLNLSHIIEKTTLAYEALAFEKHKQLTYDIKPNLYIKGDAQAISQLTSILIDNAIKYSDTQGIITIKLEKNNHIEFSVYNSGSNINESEKNHLFDRFYKLDEARTQSNSLGLGLSIAKNICEKFKYDITVHTEFNVYTEFKIIFK